MKLQTRNTLTSVLQNLIAILCGLILPREILFRYGSEMNGLMHAIAQFLSYTSLLELGIGAVIPAALYKPLALHDRQAVNAIITSGTRVFRRIALIFGAYLALLLICFPGITGSPGQLSRWMILIMGMGTLTGYLFGQPERLLLLADQKGYIVYSASAAFQLVSTAIQVILIRGGTALPAVLFCRTGIAIAQIAFISVYTRRLYALHPVQYTAEPIPQKWNGAAQHLAYFVLENTDVFLLTLMAGFEEVSVYSVYFMVISGVRRIFQSVTFSVQPKLGALWAGGDRDELNRFFALFERWIHLASALCFTLLGILLVPFVSAYTHGISDANYIRPLFAGLLTAAYACQSLRDPYDRMILASGHFRQTQYSYLIAAALNLGLSLLLIRPYGLAGAAIGTLAAMLYQAVYQSIYVGRKLLKRSFRPLLRLLLCDAAVCAMVLGLLGLLRLPLESLFSSLLALIRP